MAPETRNRTWMRTRLQYMTSQQLTDTTDLDYYINQGETEAISDWMTFHQALFREPRKSVTTDANGIFTFDAEFTMILRLETDAEFKYWLLDDADELRFGTGYFFIGADTSTGGRKVQVVKDGDPVASATLYVYDIEDVYMLTRATFSTIIPYSYRDIVPMKAAELYFRDQGGPFQVIADEKGRHYTQRLAKAEDKYKHISRDPHYMQNTSDPDAGDFLSTRLVSTP